MRWLAIAVCLVFLPAPLWAADVGRVAATRGDVVIVRGDEAVPARAGAALATGDRIETGMNGMALLQLRGGLTLTVARNTELVVGDVAPSPARAAFAGWLELVEGLLRAVLSAPSAEDDVEIRTPIAVTSVRSTEWTVEHAPEHTAVFCRDGSVAVQAAGTTVTLEPGEGSDVRGNAPPTAATQWGEPRVADTLARSTLATR